MRLWHIIPATIIALGVALFPPAPAWLSVVLVVALGFFVVATVSVVFRREGTRTLPRHEWPSSSNSPYS